MQRSRVVPHRTQADKRGIFIPRELLVCVYITLDKRVLVGGRLYTERGTIQDEPAKTSKIIIKWLLKEASGTIILEADARRPLPWLNQALFVQLSHYG